MVTIVKPWLLSKRSNVYFECFGWNRLQLWYFSGYYSKVVSFLHCIRFFALHKITVAVPTCKKCSKVCVSVLSSVAAGLAVVCLSGEALQYLSWRARINIQPDGLWMQSESTPDLCSPCSRISTSKRLKCSPTLTRHQYRFFTIQPLAVALHSTDNLRASFNSTKPDIRHI